MINLKEISALTLLAHKLLNVTGSLYDTMSVCSESYWDS